MLIETLLMLISTDYNRLQSMADRNVNRAVHFKERIWENLGRESNIIRT